VCYGDGDIKEGEACHGGEETGSGVELVSVVVGEQRGVEWECGEGGD